MINNQSIIQGISFEIQQLLVKVEAEIFNE